MYTPSDSYKCIRTIVLEDKLGVDHLFLKGYTYEIDIDTTTEYDYIKENFLGTRFVLVKKRDVYFLSEEQVDKYFKHDTKTKYYRGR